jgi:hypothetical protein
MEILSDVLRAVRLTGALFFDVELTTPWAAGSPSMAEIARAVMPEVEHVIGFHAMLSGSCWAELEGGAALALRLEAGDAVVIPSGVRHTMASAPGVQAEPDLALYHPGRPTGRCPSSCGRAARGRRRRASSAATSAATPGRSTRCSTRCRRSSTPGAKLAARPGSAA